MAVIHCVVCDCTGLEFRHICARCRDIEADEMAAVRATADELAALQSRLTAAESLLRRVHDAPYAPDETALLAIREYLEAHDGH